MAATLQPQQTNPQLKRLVYSKYREMLGSYNDKANTIIQSLPSYMVTEDKGFNFENKDDVEERFGGATAQPPACVQNAMMTKDKKPFTYTPGGIDLSEIKSPRMAKRIARNAQFEGVTGQPKPSPLAQPNATQHSPLAAPPPASALGMPVQVFPSPPPPPPVSKNGGPPPPPPQPSQNQLKLQSNGVETRKSPTPQNFEPPPFGCRPEIKIPPNPMASLKKVPKPREKNDFWIEEYRKERSSSPMVGASNQAKEQSPPTSNYGNYTQTQQMYAPPQSQPQYRPPSPPRQQHQEQPYMQQSISTQYSPLQNRMESPFASHDSANLQRPLSPIRSKQETYQQPQQQQQPYQQPQQQQPQRQAPPANRWQAPTAQQQQQQQQPQQRQQQPIRNAQVGSLYIPPVAPENLVINKQQEQGKVPVSSPPTPRWMAQKPNMKEVPEWVRDEDINSSPVQQTHAGNSLPNSGSPSTPAPAMNFQIAGNATNAKERIIPIQLENSGTPTRTPGTPGFGPQPFYNANQQFSSVPSPSSAGSGNGANSPGYAAARNPNQFVDQGYNNYQWPAPQRVTSPPAQQQQSPQPSGTRIIPIAIEGQDGPFNPNAVRGPISQSPMVIQNDPRSLQHQNSWNNGTPNQSKSFRILQKITDTEGNKEIENDQPAQIQRPLYSRPMGATTVDSPTDQMRRMQLTDQDRDFMNRVKNTVPMQRPQPPRYVQQRPVAQQEDQAQPYVHPSEQQVPEPKKYMGSAIPSRSFKILQAMTTPENAAEMEGSGVEYEQISPHNYYPPYPYPYPYPIPPYYFPAIDPNWHYPYPPPIPPYYCYYPEYDSQNCDEHLNGYYPTYSAPQQQTTDNKERVLQTPNIIVTPTPEDEEIYQKSKQFSEDSSVIQRSEQEEKETALDMLSKKLNQISVKPELDMNISKDDKKYVGDSDKDLVDSSSPINNERPSYIDNNFVEDDNSDDDLFSSSSESSAAKKTRRISSSESKEGLQAIKSVTDIKVYDQSEKEVQEEIGLTIQNDIVEDAKTDEESDEETLSSSQSTPENEQCEMVNSDSDEGEELTEDEVVTQEALSVIYEESEADAASRIRRESHASTGSTLSDCSTTIANDDSDSDDDSVHDKIKVDDLEDNQSLVTVRLPLKLSFSRSSNDENVTTVVVGDSEIEDEASSIISKAVADSRTEDADISVTFNLPSTRSSSLVSSRKLISASSSIDRVAWAGDDDNSDSEVSVSVSLPMKRDKFVAQTLSDDLSNNVSVISSDSDSDSDSSEESIGSPKDSKAFTNEFGQNRWKLVPENKIVENDHFDLDRKMDERKYNSDKTDFDMVWDWKFTANSEDIVRKPMSDAWGWSTLPSKYEVEKIDVPKIAEQVVEEKKDPSLSIEDSNDSEEDIEEEVEEEEEGISDDNDMETCKKEHELEKKSETESSEEDTEEEEEEEVESADSNHDNNDAENLTPTNICPAYKKYDSGPITCQSPFNFTETNAKSLDEVCSFSSKMSDENEIMISVRDRIAVFEAVASDPSQSESKKIQMFSEISQDNTSEKQKVLSRNSSLQKSESEFEEDDSGVTDMSKPISETDTESESFPELKKMTRYQRAATHSRLFKLLQDESSFEETSDEKKEDSPPTFHSRKKIVHNVSITRRTNPEALKNAETMTQRRERLSLPLKKTNSIDADNLSTSNSPLSPTASSIISDKLVNELVQSLLLKKKSRYLRNLPMEKLQAAAKRVLEEDLDSLENTSLESTPALTPQEFKSEGPSSYADYYETWNSKSTDLTETDYDIMPSKAFKTLQEQSLSGRRKPWAARCPRVLSSKAIHRDLARVTESPEMYRSSSVTRSTPDKHKEFTRGRSLGV